ncbi:MAG: hypothetical protein ABIJ53_02955 [Verrucomicrobiota bacterium]
MKNAVLAATVLLAGCAGLLTDVNDAQNSWRGMRYEAVVEQWGVPARGARLAGGRESHTWVSEGTLSRLNPIIGIFAGSGGGGVSVSTQPVGAPSRCERTLIFKDERVVEQTWVGEENYCSTFIRH